MGRTARGVRAIKLGEGDRVVSMETVDPEALDSDEKLQAMLGQGGFRLAKWTSNGPQLLRDIPEEQRSRAQRANLGASCSSFSSWYDEWSQLTLMGIRCLLVGHRLLERSSILIWRSPSSSLASMMLDR